MEADPIDVLLERYLGLLDEYTKLRAELSALQAAMYQNIARANFTADRGMRYGPDYYDERMQALRVVTITSDDEKAPSFEVIKAPEPAVVQNDPADGREQELEAPAETKEVRKQSRDPLRWYGLLAPMPLRQAQTQAVQIIEACIARLVTVNADMMHVEVEIRRQRKKRTRAEISPEKGSQRAEDDMAPKTQHATTAQAGKS